MRMPQLQPGAGSASNAVGNWLVQSLRYTILPIMVTMALAATGTGRATLLQSALSFGLLQIAWGAWLAWKSQPEETRDFPLFALVAGMYWMAFGVPLFWSDQAEWRSDVSAQAVTRSMMLAMVGVAALYCGMRVVRWRRLREMSTLDLRNTPGAPKYVAAVMLVGTALNFFPVAFAFGAGFRMVMMIAARAVPMVGYAILLRRQLLRPVAIYERILLVVFVLGTFLFGLASGWLGIGAVVVLVSGCVLVDCRFKIPKVAMVIVIGYILFFQPAKEQFRGSYWSGDSEAGVTERAKQWIYWAEANWGSTLSSSNPEAIRNSIIGSLGRFALLSQTANVMDLTPDIIPYQGSHMYEYLAVTLIPRAVWPDKPTVNEANRFYQLTYGMTTVRDLDQVSISVGVLTEAYISYGWAGATIIMMLVGAVLGTVNVVLLSRNSGTLMKGIGMGMMQLFISPEAQMAQFLGGMLQQIGLVIFIMLPIVYIRRRGIPGMAGATDMMARKRAMRRPVSPVQAMR